MTKVIQRVYTETEQQLTYLLVVELLAHQFCFPVKWTDTQDVILKELSSERVVEIGPADTLVRMMDKTLQAGYRARDAALGLERELLSYKRHSDAIHYKTRTTAEKVAAPPPQSSTSSVVEQTVKAKVVEAASTRNQTTEVSLTASVSVPDSPVSASVILRTLIAISLKKDRNEISPSKSIKQLCGGRSTIQNEIIGDLTKEFGHFPEQAEDLPLEELGSIVGGHRNLGALSTELLGKFVSAKLPAGSGLASLKKYLRTRWGFGEGLQESALLLTLLMQPSVRLSSEQEAHSFLDGVAETVLRDASIDPKSIATPLMTAASAVSAIPPEALDDIRKAQQKRDHQMLQLYAKRCKVDLSESGQMIQKLNGTVSQLQQELSLWITEHGETYNEGITLQFDSRKARKYDSSWNWVIQDLFEFASKTFNSDSRQSVEELAKTISLLEARATPRLLKAIKHLVRDYKQSVPSTKVPAHLELLKQLGQNLERSLSLPPIFRTTEFSSAPVVAVAQTGRIEYSEIPRTQIPQRRQFSLRKSPVTNGRKGGLITSIRPLSDTNSIISTPEFLPDLDADVVTSLSLDSFSDSETIRSQISTNLTSICSDQPSPEMPYIKSNRCGVWDRDEAISNGYLQWFETVSTVGVSFHHSTVLVTGAGIGSIGAEIVQMLLTAGAKVLVTTSSYSPEATRFFQEIYQEHGGRHSQLVVVPFNGGSQQDIASLVEYIYDDAHGLGWDPDHIIPFAAMGEAGRGIDRIDSKSEIAHRVMSTNVIRLLGSIKSQKERRRIQTHPTQVILPFSPNHGIFGQDGLYAESKLGLESLLNKWWSEDWSEYLSICGAIIGWTRGTGLMTGNDFLAAGVEDLDIRTFSKAEMGLRILGLMQAPVASCCELEPLVADLSGGLASNASLRDTLDRIQETLNSESAIKRAIAEETKRDEQVINGPRPLAMPRKIIRRARMQPELYKLPDFKTEIEPLVPELHGLVDLDRVVVVVGFGETGPCGNSRTRWQMETDGIFSIDGCLEMAWIMGLVKYHRGLLQGKEYCGWIDTKSGAPVVDAEVKAKYESYILAHTGIRVIERREHEAAPDQKTFMHEVAVTEDLEPFEASPETAQDLKREHGDNVVVTDLSEGGQHLVTIKAGATIMVPKAKKFEHAVGAQMPTGWDPKVYGIPADIVSQVDPVTLYTLVSTVEAFLAAGITDPYELYQHIHVSEVGICIGSGMGGVKSLHRMFKQRFLDRQVQKDILAETFINTTSAWVNMLLLGGAGPIKTPVGACATSLESVDTGCELIVSGKAKACLVGGFDGLEQDVAAEFANMRATVNVETENMSGRSPSEMSRPTSSTRAGFVESEGCGVQLLTSAKLALDMGMPIRSIVALTHTASDKIGRSVPAPGRGLLTIAKEEPTKFPPPLLNMAYRRRLLEMRKSQIEQQSVAEMLWLEDRMRDTYSTELECTINKSIQECQREIEASAQKAVKETLNTYGNEFWKGDKRISPLRGALAVWGLTVDDLNVASLHGTSTVLNDLNETAVIQQQLTHLARTDGNVIPCVCQKSLVGHAKGAAGAFALNGCIQMLASGTVPGNRNADNIDSGLAASDLLFFPNRTLQTQGIKAFSVTAFGFGQKGAQVIGVHPRYLFATISEQEYDRYRQRVNERMEKARRYFQDGFCGNSLVQLKEKSPYDDDQTAKVLTDPRARL